MQRKKKSKACIYCDIDTGLSIGHQDQLAVTRHNMHGQTPQIKRRVKVRIVIVCMLLPNYLMIMTSVNSQQFLAKFTLQQYKFPKYVVQFLVSFRM